jgi:hypothetical protein
MCVVDRQRDAVQEPLEERRLAPRPPDTLASSLTLIWLVESNQVTFKEEMGALYQSWGRSLGLTPNISANL